MLTGTCDIGQVAAGDTGPEMSSRGTCHALAGHVAADGAGSVGGVSVDGVAAVVAGKTAQGDADTVPHVQGHMLSGIGE